ncbi:PAS domain S-box-containing protein [Algoriphagus sp. 4150]|uniref:PAS domain S-box protein n=1 Tax=Algoriphagus sp. 4150 TaxID=2817756 RepID=UPI00285C972A|nr:PAS domain S-box protein [Algoriphagus sp. 4150]MDR7127887.1 PAS domain S-box-containing protein [Algoriphagus sp. 4150]
MVDSDAVISATSRAFTLLHESNNLQEALQGVLRELGQQCGLDCAFIIRNLHSGRQMSYEFEWSKNGESCYLNKNGSKPQVWENSEAMDKILGEGYIHFPSVDSDNGIIPEIPKINQANSCLLIPIYSFNELWGILGLEDGGFPVFTPSSIALLKNFAGSLGSVIYGVENRRNYLECKKNYQRIIENIRDVVFTLDYSFNLISLNGGWERLSGYDSRESLGQSVFLFVERTYKDYFVKELEGLANAVTQEVSIDLPLITSTNALRWVRITAKRLVEKEGELFGTILDIHQNMMSVDKLRESHSAFKSLFNTVEDVLYIRDPKTKTYSIMSEKISRLGLSQKKFIDNSSYWLEIVHPDDRREVEECVRESWNSGNLDLEYRVINGHGVTLWVENKAWMEYDPSGRPFRLHGRYSDITTVKTKELELIESEERFKAISENLPFPLIMCTPDKMEVLYINEFFLSMISQSSSSIRSDFDIDDYVFHPDPSISVRSYIQNAVEIDNLEVLVHEEDGDNWYSLSSQKLPYKGGFVLTIILYNIHKRKLAELERIRLEEVLHALDQTQISFSMEVEVRETYTKLLSTLIFFTKSEYGFLGEVLYDDTGKPYLRSNAIRNTECSPDVQRFIDLHSEKGFIFRGLDNLIGKVLLSGKSLISNHLDEGRLSHANLPSGHPILKRFLGIPIYKGERFIGMVGLANKEKMYSQEDIDFLQPFMSSYANLISLVNENKQRIKAESLHQESENLYKILSDNVDDIVSLHDLELKTLYVSPSVERVTGFLPKVLLGKNFFEYVNYSLEPQTDFEKYPKFVIPINHMVSGKTIRIEMIWKPLYNEQGKLYSFLATSRDVTDRESILVKLKETLDKEKELNQLKSRFIAMTSHEFRTPLATIFSSTDLLEMILRQLDDQDIKNKSLRHIEKISAQLSRLTHMVSDVLLMEQNSDGRLNVNLSQLNFIEIILETLQDSFSFDANNPCILLDLPPHPVSIKSDRTWLTYIIKNIVENAFKYSVGREKIPELMLKQKGGKITLQVQDYGIGVPKAEQKFIFDPFYRSSNASSVKGTGLGLSIVYELVLKLGGKIELKSKENLGTAIAIVFPDEAKTASGRNKTFKSL